MASELSVTDGTNRTNAGEATGTGAPAQGTEPGHKDTQRELRLDNVFELLQSYRRRAVLRYLDDHPSATRSSLAEHVAAQENGKSVQQLSSAERKRVYISLYQSHLPKLDDAGVIEYDSDRGTVDRNPSADHLTTYLDWTAGSVVRGERPAWPYYYLGIALSGGGLLAAQLALLPSVAATAVVAVAIIAVLAGLALVHARHDSAAPA